MSDNDSKVKNKDTKLKKKYQKTKQNSDCPKFDLGPARSVLNKKNKDKR